MGPLIANIPLGLLLNSSRISPESRMQDVTGIARSGRLGPRGKGRPQSVSAPAPSAHFIPLGWTCMHMHTHRVQERVGSPGQVLKGLNFVLVLLLIAL